MADRAVLKAILVHFLFRNSFFDTDIGKTALESGLFSQYIQAKGHFKKFFSPKWQIEPC
jgi:hypothetical protein